GEVGFEESMAVPVQDGDPLPGFDTQARKSGRQSVDPAARLGVGEPSLATEQDGPGGPSSHSLVQNSRCLHPLSRARSRRTSAPNFGYHKRVSRLRATPENAGGKLGRDPDPAPETVQRPGEGDPARSRGAPHRPLGI